MSAPLSALLPTLALQLAGRVDTYSGAIRRSAIDSSDLADVTGNTGSLLGVMEAARPIPALWSTWGLFVIANAEFGLQRLNHAPQPSLQKALREIDAAADALITEALEWALLKQHRFPFDEEIAQAFIAWENARKTAYELRSSAVGRTMGRSLGTTPSVDDSELRDWQCYWEARAATLLMHAVSALEGRMIDLEHGTSQQS